MHDIFSCNNDWLHTSWPNKRKMQLVNSIQVPVVSISVVPVALMLQMMDKRINSHEVCSSLPHAVSHFLYSAEIILISMIRDSSASDTTFIVPIHL